MGNDVCDQKTREVHCFFLFHIVFTMTISIGPIESIKPMSCLSFIYIYGSRRGKKRKTICVTRLQKIANKQQESFWSRFLSFGQYIVYAYVLCVISVFVNFKLFIDVYYFLAQAHMATSLCIAVFSWDLIDLWRRHIRIKKKQTNFLLHLIRISDLHRRPFRFNSIYY